MIRVFEIPAPITVTAQTVEQIQLVIKIGDVVYIAEERFNLCNDTVGMKRMSWH